jgi:hypothetical protein
MVAHQREDAVTGLIEATALTPANDGYVAALDPGWDIWGPAGGYSVAITFRAVRERADGTEERIGKP